MLHGLKYDFIEDLLINLRLLKPPPAVLAENGVMRYRIGQRKTNKPTVGDVDPDFLNEASFRTNSVQITDQKHFEQHDRIDARTPIILTIQGAAFFRDKRKVDGFIDFSKQVILGNKVFYVDCFGLKFPGWVRPEHIKTFLRNCFIPNSTKKAVDPSLSTASPGLSDRVFVFLKKDIQGKREMHPVFLSVPLSHRPPNPARFSSDFQGQNLPTPLIYRATSAAKLSGVEPLTSRFQDGSTAPQPTCQLPSGEKRNKPAASAFYRVPEMKRAGGSPPKFPARPALRMSRSSVVKEKVRGWQGPSSYAAQTRSLTS